MTHFKITIPFQLLIKLIETKGIFWQVRCAIPRAFHVEEDFPLKMPDIFNPFVTLYPTWRLIAGSNFDGLYLQKEQVLELLDHFF